MNPLEPTIVPGTLTDIVPLKGGQKGKPFVLKNHLGEEVVIKFQRENPAEAMAGSFVLQQAGAQTPNIRLLLATEVQILVAALNGLPAKCSDDAEKFKAASLEFPHALVMGFVAGASTLKSLREDALTDFLVVICDTDFQGQLGKIIAADAFVGNFDRMYAIKDGENKVGWYHEQNTLVAAKKPVAIDNGFRPEVYSGQFVPWGKYVAMAGFQVMSLASADRELAKLEAGALFDKFMDSALKNHPTQQQSIDLARSKRSAFVDEVSRTATATMKLLLQRGKHWKQQFSNYGIKENVLEQFRRRKQILRLLAEGVAPDLAVSITGDPEKKGYRKWVLMNELSLDEDTAEAVLKDSLEAYKQAKAKARAVAL